jgi:hypothetical protein
MSVFTLLILLMLTTGTEVSGGSYARTAVTFGAPSDGVTTNSAAVEFPQATGSWGSVGWIGYS